MNKTENIKKNVSNFPHEPGVYLMKDEEDTIIYIGKASSLKKRVSSYFNRKDRDVKTRVLVKSISSIEYIVTDSEIEALILESNLIKKHQPKYNVRLKDDKHYPYIAITLPEAYPRVIYTRSLSAKSGFKYYGPYTDARAAKNIVAMINNIFKLKTCRKDLPLKKNERPCLNYQIKKCSGACMKKITNDEYREIIDNAINFLDGEIDPLLNSLNSKMNLYSEKFDYEKAAQIRDIIFDIQKVFESQKVYVPIGMDQDYIAVSIFKNEAVLIIFEFRKGVLLGRKISIFDNARYSNPGEIVRSFILDYYTYSEIPVRIITPEKIEDKEIIEAYLTERSSRKVLVSRPTTPDDRGVINMIRRNIDLVSMERQTIQDTQKFEEGLQELKSVLKMKDLPATIVCFDISNLQGKDAVASMVQFTDGFPDKSQYRRFKIRGYTQANDPGMMHEVVSRRLQHLVNEDEELPDLMVIDGGPTQLTRAMEAAANFDIDVNIISLAKQFEEIYFDPKETPLRLKENSPALHILQHIRDESHRFAITYHRKLRDRKTTSSQLDQIPGIADKTRQVLLEHFKSVDSIKEATIEKICETEGIGAKTAKKIYSFFHKGDNENDSI